MKNRQSIRNPQSAIRNTRAHKSDQVAHRDKDEQEAVSREKRKVLSNAADHRAEQVGAEVFGRR